MILNGMVTSLKCKKYSRYEMSWVINIRDDSRRRSYGIGRCSSTAIESCTIFDYRFYAST